MQKINFNLDLASMIPDFLYQFTLNGHVEQGSITCLELEDLRDALKSVNDPEMADIKKFLSMENDTHECEECGHEHGPEHEHAPADPVSQAMDEVDEEIIEVDDEFFHKYTPAEIKYIFEKIVYNIDKVYKYYMDYTTMNLALTVGLRLEGGLETNLVVEFFTTGYNPGPVEAGYYLPVKNAMVSDSVALRAYLICEEGKEAEFDAVLTKVTDIMNVKVEDRYKEGLN